MFEFFCFSWSSFHFFFRPVCSLKQNFHFFKFLCCFVVLNFLIEINIKTSKLSNLSISLYYRFLIKNFEGLSWFFETIFFCFRKKGAFSGLAFVFRFAVDMSCTYFKNSSFSFLFIVIIQNNLFSLRICQAFVQLLHEGMKLQELK